MNATRIDKEFHPLFWPWAGATLVACLPVANFLIEMSTGNREHRTVLQIADWAYFLAVVLFAVLPFGSEFQHRTMPLLLSQPCSRRRQWREKVAFSLVPLAAVIVAHTLCRLPYFYILAENWVLAASLTLLLFSAGLCFTLLTRTIIGGIVLSLVTLAVVYLTAFAFGSPIYTPPGSVSFELQTRTFQTLTALALAPLLLWLSWWQFSRLQSAGNWEAEAGISLSSTEDRRGVSFLRSRAAHPVYNLALKELHLLKPIFVMAIMFLGLWLLALLAVHYLPHRKAMLANFMDGCCAIYVPLVALLAGCISLSEEKNSGIHAANLTSPISINLQWLVKNLMACFAGLLVTIGLLHVMLYVTSGKLEITPFRILFEPVQTVLLAYGLILALIQCSFWAATVTRRTTHAVSLAIAAAVCLIPLFLLVLWLGQFYVSAVEKPIYLLISRGQWSDDLTYSRIQGLYHCFLVFSFSAVILTGWLCFRRLQSERQILILSAKSLGAILLFWGLLSGAISASGAQDFRETVFYKETFAALQARDADVYKPGQNPRYNLSYEDLRSTGKLSPMTAQWLHGSKITIIFSTQKDYIYAVIQLPSGGEQTVLMHPRAAETP
jgi:hypothetical protein